MSTPAKPIWKKPALRLMAEAERLIGEHGYDNVSLVQIARVAGQANKYAVQYHFGDKESLVRAIFDDRLARIGARRRALLDQLRASGKPGIHELLTAFIYPVYQEVDERGLHSYARFAERMLDTPLVADMWFASEHFATTDEVRRELAGLCGHLSGEEFTLRYSLVSALLTQTLTVIDRAARQGGESPRQSPERILDTAIAMACEALALASSP